MDKKDLEARAERRRKLAEGPSLPLAEEIAKAWMDLAMAKGWDPRLQKQVPEDIPVGPAFESWVDDYLKRSRFRFREFDGASRLAAKEVAKVIDVAGNRLVGRDFPNPLSLKKEKGAEHFTVASVKTADTIYGPVKYPDRHRTLYTSPFEWTRYCPEHAGVMLHRLPGGAYQCPIKGDIWSYTDGHPVEHKIGVQNQTNPNWNDTWPQPGFLSTPNQQSTRASGGTYDKIEPKKDVDKFVTTDKERLAVLPGYSKEKDTDVKPTVELYAKAKGFTRKAERKLQIESKVFGPPQEKTRYCPDHEGVMTYRISDDVHQCPVDRAIYDYAQGFKTQDGREFHGGSVAEMTPDRPDYYQSPHPFLVVDSSVKVKGLVRKSALVPKPDPQELKLKDVREEQKSGLREYQEVANKWVDPQYPLEQAKKEFSDIVSKVLDAKSLQRALAGIQKARSGAELARHFFDLLLKHEGQGVLRAGQKGQTKKAYSNLEQRFVFDLSHVLANGSADSKKVVQLVIDNVMRGGKTLPEALHDAYTVIDQSSFQPSATVEVAEEPLSTQPAQPTEGLSLETPLQ